MLLSVGVVLSLPGGATAEEPPQRQWLEPTSGAAAPGLQLGYLALGVGATYRWNDVEGEILGETVRAEVPTIGVGVELVLEIPAFTDWLLLGGGLIWFYPGENESELDDPANFLPVRSVTGLDLGPGALWRPVEWFAVAVSPHAFLGWEERSICRGPVSGSTITCEEWEGSTGFGVGGLLRVGTWILVPLGGSWVLPVGLLARVVVATQPGDAIVPLSHAAAMVAVGIGSQ